LKKFDFNQKVADDYINVLAQKAKEINSGEWIQVSQRSKQRISKDGNEKQKEIDGKKDRKDGKKFDYQNNRNDNFYGNIYREMIFINKFNRFRISELLFER
jgi:hypothetical protein